MLPDLEPLGPANLDAFANLLGGDDFGGCFCAVWTAHGDDWVARCRDPARPNLDVTRQRIAAGEHVGFLVRDAGVLVAWTGAGPKTGFPFLATRLGARRSPMTDDVWCIGCLAVTEARRGTGLAERIVQAVVHRARDAGARALEAYPVRPWDEPRSYRGHHRTYERLGFAEVAAEPDGESEILLVRIELT